METKHEFEKTFIPNSIALQIGLKLRELIFNHFDNIDEKIYGGAKVKLTLYNIKDTETVLCGIQQSSNDTCMLYVHHIESINHDRLKFSGKGKHAKRIKFISPNEIIDNEIYWLFSLIEEGLSNSDSTD